MTFREISQLNSVSSFPYGFEIKSFFPSETYVVIIFSIFNPYASMNVLAIGELAVFEVLFV